MASLYPSTHKRGPRISSALGTRIYQLAEQCETFDAESRYYKYFKKKAIIRGNNVMIMPGSINGYIALDKLGTSSAPNVEYRFQNNIYRWILERIISLLPIAISIFTYSELSIIIKIWSNRSCVSEIAYMYIVQLEVYQTFKFTVNTNSDFYWKIDIAIILRRMGIFTRRNSIIPQFFKKVPYGQILPRLTIRGAARCVDFLKHEVFQKSFGYPKEREVPIIHQIS
ncbi:hypothetical protein BDA99DRAFT_544314 [Phascolomyces articulosus]|uniref:Uncharacterized protein n=1 Tax=Phascolomyces articulosus TaxID=60185 RepID=A0AAD5JW49_9FUNG|nr:hypothetical protein BDA99DRAFT_544314 [Phascolomyces articulosus]